MKKRALQFIVWFVGDGTTKAFDVDLTNDTLLLADPTTSKPLSACYLAGITKANPVGVEVANAVPVTGVWSPGKVTFTFQTAPQLNATPPVPFWLFF